MLLSKEKGSGYWFITITVSDGTKAVVRSFSVIVNPDVQMDKNLVVNATGTSKNGWNDPQSRFSSNGAFQHNYNQDYYMDQDINIGKFSALIDARFLTYTATCDVNNSGKMILIFIDSTGSEISESGSGSGVLVPNGTRTIRVKIGGSSGCSIDNVSFMINSIDLPKMTSISNQSIYSGSSTGEIPFTVGYAESSAVITAASSNTALVPVSGISIEGSDYQRTIKVTPNSGISGSSTIKLMVNGKEVTSFLVTIIYPITDITVQPGSATVTYSYIDAPRFRVTAQKAEGVGEIKDITYQWYYGDGTCIENAKYAEYTIPTGLSAGSYSYYCAVTCDWYTENSDTITLTVQKATAEITIEEKNISYAKIVGEEAFNLSGITKTGDGSLTYSSSNTEAVTVDENGKVTIVGEGEAVITVSMAETANYTAAVSKTVAVRANVRVPVTGISLDKDTLTMKARGAEATLTAAVTPEDANNKNIIWSSSDTKVATVTDGVVIPLSHGTATITVTTEEGNCSASCTVTVEASECPASYYGVQKRVNTETMDIRLIAMINTLEADEVGFVYSVSDKVPTIGKDGCNSLSNIEVYKTIKVNNESKKASELGGMGAYFIVSILYDINAIAPEDMLYVCAYVKKDGVYTYTEVREITVSELQ